MGIKYHIRMDHPEDLISLHIFKDGYSGLSKIEDGKYCLCYLSLKDNLKGHSSIQEMEKEVLCRKPSFKRDFCQCRFSL